MDKLSDLSEPLFPYLQNRYSNNFLYNIDKEDFYCILKEDNI